MSVGSAHSEILFFAFTFVRKRKVGERKEDCSSRNVWRVGLRLEWRGERRRKSGIQWPVSSREDTYVMLDLNATKRERKSGRGREREELRGGKGGSREVAVDEQ